MRTDNLREVKLSEIMDLKIYPVADILPLLEKSIGDDSKKNTVTLVELADNIRENGLQEPLILFTVDDVTMLLDGRNRRLACQLAAKTDKVDLEDYEIQIMDFLGSEDEADDFVFVKGLNRRDLTASQRAISAAKFEYDCSEAFLRMKGKAETAKIAGLSRGDKIGPTGGDNANDVNYLLAQIFHVSVGYVKDARRKFREEKEARQEAVRHTEQATLLEEEAKEANLRVEEAKLLGDSSSVWEAAQTKNNALEAAADEREMAAVKAQQASQKANEIAKIHNKQASLREPKKEQKAESDDPVKQLRTKLNSGITNLKQIVSDLAKVSGQSSDDYNYIGRKVSELIESFEESFGILKED